MSAGCFRSSQPRLCRTELLACEMRKTAACIAIHYLVKLPRVGLESRGKHREAETECRGKKSPCRYLNRFTKSQFESVWSVWICKRIWNSLWVSKVESSKTQLSQFIFVQNVKKSEDINFAADFFLSTLSEQQSQGVPAVEHFSRAFCGSGSFWKQLQEMAAGVSGKQQGWESLPIREILDDKIFQYRNIFLNSLGVKRRSEAWLWTYQCLRVCYLSLWHFFSFIFSPRGKK